MSTKKSKSARPKQVYTTSSSCCWWCVKDLPLFTSNLDTIQHFSSSFAHIRIMHAASGWFSWSMELFCTSSHLIMGLLCPVHINTDMFYYVRLPLWCTWYISEEKNRRKNCNPGGASVGETESTTVTAVEFHSIAKAAGASKVARGSLSCRCPCSSRVYCANLRHETRSYFLLCWRAFFIDSF